MKLFIGSIFLTQRIEIVIRWKVPPFEISNPFSPFWPWIEIDRRNYTKLHAPTVIQVCTLHRRVWMGNVIDFWRALQRQNQAHTSSNTFNTHTFSPPKHTNIIRWKCARIYSNMITKCVVFVASVVVAYSATRCQCDSPIRTHTDCGWACLAPAGVCLAPTPHTEQTPRAMHFLTAVASTTFLLAVLWTRRVHQDRTTKGRDRHVRHDERHSLSAFVMNGQVRILNRPRLAPMHPELRWSWVRHILPVMRWLEYE